MMEAFHFLHPLWLVALPVIALTWWMLRPKRHKAQADMQGVAPHLATALEVGDGDRTRLHPVDGAALVAVLLALGAAGPAWTRAPNPLVADTAPLVIALEVTPSMDTTDLPPTRADRARFKALDLVESRAGARTALVAYAGTAHRVAPLTEDPGILRPLLQSLSPATMPVDGDAPAAALTIAQDILSDADTPGAVLFMLDDLPPDAVQAFQDATVPVLALAITPDVPAQLAGLSGVEVIQITADDRDLTRINRKVRAAYVTALAEDDRLQWQDRGWWLAWPAALLALLWFRRGWAVLGLMLLMLPAPPAMAQTTSHRAQEAPRDAGIADWFWTRDQQGQQALDRKDFGDAAQDFITPELRGYAMYKDGQYANTVELFSQIDTAEAAFVQGMAHIKNREYRPAIKAFETALERRPDYSEAQDNLVIAKVVLKTVEDAREASDSGEERGIGADDIVFDNEDKRGTDTQVEAEDGDSAPMTADQWIDSIDTDMTKFLRSRFLLDNSEAAK